MCANRVGDSAQHLAMAAKNLQLQFRISRCIEVLSPLSWLCDQDAQLNALFYSDTAARDTGGEA